MPIPRFGAALGVVAGPTIAALQILLMGIVRQLNGIAGQLSSITASLKGAVSRPIAAENDGLLGRLISTPSLANSC